MKKQHIYNIIITAFVIVFSACGTDTKENPPKSDGPYSFINATTPVKITLPVEINGTQGTTEAILSVQLLAYNVPIAGASIQMEPFDNRYGSVSPLLSETDADGYVIFQYKYDTPEKYNDIKNQDFTLRVYYEGDMNLNAPVAPLNGPKPPNIAITQEFILQFR